MSASGNWMDEANRLARMWSDQQQKFVAMMTGPAVAGAAPSAMGIPAGMQQAQELWRTSIEKWMALAPQGLTQSAGANDMLKAMFDPAQWADTGLGPLDRAIEHLVEGPGYATLWTLDRKFAKAQKLRADWARDLAAWQVMMQGAWNEAVRRFLLELNETDGTPITTWRGLADLWLRVANDTLTATHRTPEFLEAQRRLTRSSTDCRLAEREIAEVYCEINHIPTRTEVDELQRTVYELRRDLRALTKSLRTTAAPVARTRKPRTRG